MATASASSAPPAAASTPSTASSSSSSSTPAAGAGAAAAASSSSGSGSGSAAPAYASASLYVGDLLPEVTEALLFETFNAVGPVASVRVCRDSATRRSLGYAYVNFHRVDDAERALDAMNFKPIRGRPARIMWSHRDPSLRKSGAGNIFVKNLARTIDNKMLYDTFSVFGNILSCKVAANIKGASLGYGFVHYESDDAAANAIAKVDGKVIALEQVSVAAFKSKKERGGSAKHARFTNLYVKCLPSDFTESKLTELFSKFGKVTSSMLHFEKESKRPPKKAPAAVAGAESKAAAPTPAAPEGYGFVNFQAPEEATAALDALNNFEVAPGQRLYVARAQKREEREKELRERFEQLKIERAKKYAGVNLYVKNLADEVDDDRLRAEFARFGSITSARVMRDDATKKSRGFGFVCFSTPDEATKAVTEMNGKMFESKPLYVALAQRKEQRRAQLEARHQARGKMGGPGGPHGAMPPPMYPPQGPMYYSPGPPGARGNFIYPGQPMGRGWMGPLPGQPMPMGRGPMAYQLMPVAGGAPGARGGERGPLPGAGGPPGARGGPRGPGGAGGPGAGGDRAAAAAAARGAGGPGGAGAPGAGAGPRGAGAGAGAGAGPRPGPPAVVSAGGSAYNLSANVRNPQAQGRPAAPAPSAEAPEPAIGAAASSATAPLTIKTLAAAPEKQKKQMIGEQLFPLIKAREPALAGKITGMLLEMDNVELIHLLESGQALAEKITEAMAVLQAHEAAAAEEEEEEESTDMK